MGDFNIQYLAQLMPFLADVKTSLFEVSLSELDHRTPEKILDDGYISIFAYNFITIFFTWLTSYAIYLISVLTVNLLNKVTSFTSY
jgi:hypothetical protein